MTTNNEKILKALENKKELIKTTALSIETGIDIKNISRYLKALESKGLIVRKTIQNGKIRVVKIGLLKVKKGEITPKPIEIKDLKPPKPTIEKIVPQDNTSDYLNKFIQNQSITSDSKRNRYYVITGKSWRGTNESLDLALYQHYKELEEFRDSQPILRIPQMKTITEKYKRGNSQDKKLLINELKEALAKRKLK